MRNRYIWLVLALFLLATVTLVAIISTEKQNKMIEKQISTQVSSVDTLNKNRLQQLQDQIQTQNKQIQQLNSKIQAKLNTASVEALTVSAVQSVVPVVKAAVEASVEPQNWYKAWIYNEESGNSPTRWNSSGCLGLGQACPASKLLNVCPNEDYVCEDNWFTNYMTNRYGTWENAYNFHIANGWW